ncbi:MAG: UDP-N-acetylmuramate dehydrogenase [Ilumatobacteraceae bacterium]
MSDRRQHRDDELKHAAEILGDLGSIDSSLAQFTTYRLGGPASIYVHVESIEELHLLSAALRDTQLPLLVIGHGSNLLIADEGFRGVAITLGHFAEGISFPEPGAEPIAVLGGSVSMPVAARQSVHYGLTGFEWAVGVPGTVGGGVRMNAGGHGSDMAASLRRVRVYHLLKGIEANVQAFDLGLRFRGSALTDHHIVLNTTLKLNWGDVTEGEARLAEIVHWRRENQPGGQNAGSVFINPEPGRQTAAELIDQLGLRGTRFGTASISEKHANFIQADAGGSAHDVVSLMAEVRHRVRESYGIDLRTEVRLVGFDPHTHPDLADIIGSTTDTSVATIRLEQVFGVAQDGSDPLDATIPLTMIRKGGAFVGSEDIPHQVLAELRDAFNSDGTPIEIPRSEVSTVAIQPDRIIIEDEALRKPSDVDFPADVRAQSVHHAPSSTRIIIDDIDNSAQPVEALLGIDDGRGLDDGLTKTGWLRRRLRAIRLRVMPSNSTKRRKRVFLALCTIIVLVLISIVVLASPIVAVRKVSVEGARYTDAALVQSVVESLKGHSVLTVDTREAERRLESNPWVEDARIRTYFPDRVVIEIAERIPAAWFVGVDNRARVIDSDGRVLSVVDGQPTEYRQITGIGPNLTAGAVATVEYQAAAQLATSIPAELEPLVASLGIGGPNQITMSLKTGTVINFGPPVDIRNKLISVVVLLRRQNPEKIISIDVSSGTPVVKSA